MAVAAAAMPAGALPLLMNSSKQSVTDGGAWWSQPTTVQASGMGDGKSRALSLQLPTARRPRVDLVCHSRAASQLTYAACLGNMSDSTSNRAQLPFSKTFQLEQIRRHTFVRSLHLHKQRREGEL